MPGEEEIGMIPAQTQLQTALVINLGSEGKAVRLVPAPLSSFWGVFDVVWLFIDVFRSTTDSEMKS